jgi:hypothetical protein
VQLDQGATLDASATLSAHQIFSQRSYPLLTPTCGGCHGQASGVGPGFLALPDPAAADSYSITSAWNNFVVATPELSALLTKGQHEGPSLTMSQYDSVLSWLKQEKAERDAVSLIPFNPQVPPFAVVIYDPAKPLTQYNYVDLGQINPLFAGAVIRFTAKTLSAGSGLEISDLRLINTKSMPQPGEQRSIHLANPLFVLWRGGVPFPDPANSFSGTDRTIALNQDDPGAKPGSGSMLIPGLLVLNQYRTGYSLSITFSVVEVVKPVVGSNPCTAGQLTFFTNNLVRYIGTKKAGVAASCAQAGKCHDAITVSAGLDMTAAVTNTNLGPLCEQLKFYNGLSIIEQNTDPNGTYNHPFKWYPTSALPANPDNCSVLVAPTEEPCFPNFQTKLAQWRNTP